MFKKLFLILLLAAVLLLALCACSTPGVTPDPNDTGQGTETEGTTVTDSGTTETEDPSDTITDPFENVDGFPLVVDGNTIDIVHPLYDMQARVLANKLANLIEFFTGVRPTVKSDWLAAGTEHDSTCYEVLVGAVNYPEYQTAYSQLYYGDSALLTVGNKLCIVSMNGDGLDAVYMELWKQMLAGCSDDSKSILLEKEISTLVQVNASIRPIPRFADKTPFGCYESASSGYQMIFTQISEADLTNYRKTVENDGYTLYTENTHTKKGNETNQFLTYTTRTHVLTLAYTGVNDTLRVILDSREDTELAGLPEENVYTKGVCDTTLTQVGLMYTLGNMNGMAYVMRLEDGSFIVIDGGHDLAANATRLYEIMKKQAPDPNNIVIAAWFFSHTHGDHTGFFRHFAQNYASKVKVERFIYNFPIESQFTASEVGTATAVPGIESSMSKFGGAKVTRARPGQIYYIRNATVEMLYTADLYLPKIIDYGNTASVCFRIETEGVKTMITGDIGAAVATEMLAIYNDDVFKSDILQVAHHGIGSHPNALYPKIDPSYALWPLGTGPLSKWSAQEDCIVNVQAAANKWFFESEKCKDHVYLAEDDVYVLTLKDSAVTKVEKYDNVDAYLAR